MVVYRNTRLKVKFMGRLNIFVLLCVGIMLLGGCASNAQEQISEAPSGGGKSNSTAEQSADQEKPAGASTESETEDSGIGESNIENSESHLDDTVYIGEYLDSDFGEPNLEIAKGNDGKYIVQIGIYRLTSLSDGIGELTDEGMKFTATDTSGNPIRGVITVEDQTAIVTFTDSTWENLQNGSVFRYTKSSDTPNIWSE